MIYIKFRNTALVTMLLVFASVCLNAENEDSYPVIKDHSVWTITGVGYDNSDFSGLDFSFDSTRFVGVFNSAGVYWIDIPTENDAVASTAPLLAIYEAQGIARDLEAVCVDRCNGDIYLGQERMTRDGEGYTLYEGNTIYRLDAPYYSNQKALATFDNTLMKKNNATIEGLAMIGEGRFLVGREGSRKKEGALPPALIEWSEKDGVICVKDVPEEMMQIADVVYDPVRRCLWISDSDFKKELYMCTLDGVILATYDISFIANAEAICIDRSHSCIWIGSDETPSKLYKVSFDNL